MAIDIDAVEGALADLQRFCTNFRADILPQLSTVLKCVQVMQRVENAFVAAGEVAGAALTARATRLLDDFFNALRGLRITSTIETIDANALAESVIRNLRDRPPLNDVVPPIGETEAAFGRSLAQRLAFVDILRNVEIDFALLEAPAQTLADGQRLTDVLMDAVELIAAAGTDHIVLRKLRNGENMNIEVHSIAAVGDQSFRLTLGPIQYDRQRGSPLPDS